MALKQKNKDAAVIKTVRCMKTVRHLFENEHVNIQKNDRHKNGREKLSKCARIRYEKRGKSPTPSRESHKKQIHHKVNCTKLTFVW